ncbi:MAG: hypothetical protein ACLTZT_06000 [Butyricimonas faecalis]
MVDRFEFIHVLRGSGLCCQCRGRGVHGEVKFITDNAIYISEPGTLSEVIGERLKYELTEISISGKLNGSDFRLLRDMLGRELTEKRLRES